MQTKNIIIRWTLILLVIYLAYGFYLYLNQANFIYYPDEQDFATCTGFNDYEKLEQDGTRFYYKENSLEKVLVYYHGNAGSACDRAYNKQIFEDTGRSVIFVEYAGYSNDARQVSQELIYQDVENIQTFIRGKDFTDLMVYGQSIGSAAASYHVGIAEVDSLILVSPFNNFVDLVQSKYIVFPAFLLVKDKYDNLVNLENYKNPLLILHGVEDLGIPPKFSRELFDSLNIEDKNYILIEGAGHNDLWMNEGFKNELSSFINSK